MLFGILLALLGLGALTVTATLSHTLGYLLVVAGFALGVNGYFRKDSR